MHNIIYFYYFLLGAIPFQLYGYFMHFFYFFIISESDYSGLPVTLTFTEAGEECFVIGITQDNLLEGTENFYLVLATRDDDIIFYIRSAVVYIVDGNSMLLYQFSLLACTNTLKDSTHPLIQLLEQCYAFLYTFNFLAV